LSNSSSTCPILLPLVQFFFHLSNSFIADEEKKRRRGNYWRSLVVCTFSHWGWMKQSCTNRLDRHGVAWLIGANQNHTLSCWLSVIYVSTLACLNVYCDAVCLCICVYLRPEKEHKDAVDEKNTKAFAQHLSFHHI
jgi:hypothetical protein